MWMHSNPNIKNSIQMCYWDAGNDELKMDQIWDISLWSDESKLLRYLKTQREI